MGGRTPAINILKTSDIRLAAALSPRAQHQAELGFNHIDPPDSAPRNQAIADEPTKPGGAVVRKDGFCRAISGNRTVYSDKGDPGFCGSTTMRT